MARVSLGRGIKVKRLERSAAVERLELPLVLCEPANLTLNIEP
jgi:hypothetical protein